MKHLNEEDLILQYYAEPGARGDAKSHLAECAECRGAAEALARSLRLCNDLAVPGRAADFGRDVWNRLAPALAAEPVRGRPFPMRLWLAWAGLAVLLVGVFFAGRLSRPAFPARGVAPEMAGLSDQARERILAIAVADHLDRVQMLLTEIANGKSSGPDGFAADRARAEDLVQEGRLMRQTMAEQGESATTHFLDEVQRFLMEAAHTPDNATDVRDLRERIESRSLLFKVRVVESNLRNEEQKL